MSATSWKSQIAVGRVFELRSKSTRWPLPCGLIVDADAPGGWGAKFITAIDSFGVIGHRLYSRSHNPNIYVDGMRRDQFTSARIARRRHYLEKFDGDDMDLIRYGYSLDFDGRIDCTDPSIPLGTPAKWTVFWLPAYREDEFLYPKRKHRRFLKGAWWFEKHGGPAHLGYKYGHCWATRHTGRRLDAVRKSIRAEFPQVIEMHSSVVRWTAAGITYTTEMRDGECPALYPIGTDMKGGAYYSTTEHIQPPTAACPPGQEEV
jgi:hypothetical protein